MIPCSYAHGCGEAWADAEYVIKHPIWTEPQLTDLCEDCFQKWCEAFPTEFDTDQ
ncbi:hypothetical protein [Halorubrum halodurans]|uniref:hypothetical protein n=1 Tax=Halorubrum halodurans TaxID=1383851 RepID=UPI0015C6117D|nr:hypothetical protein [Halorubrum halodurans]